MTKKTDAVLPAWGPYSKKYMGISHIPHPDSLLGARFDCVVFPTVTNSGTPVPNATVPSHYHPWHARADLSFIEYRCELEWKDRVYADVSFTHVSDEAILIRTAFVNRTRLAQNCMLNYFCAMEFPHDEHCIAQLPAGGQLWNAGDYASYHYAISRPWDSQNPDGAKKGEFRDPRFSGSSGLGDRVEHWHIPQLTFRPFGAEAGDAVTYALPCGRPYADAVLGIRYRTVPAPGVGDCTFRASGLVTGDIRFPRADSLSVLYVPVGKVAAGNFALELTAAGSAGGVELDCLFLIEAADKPHVSFRMEPYDRIPQLGEQGAAVTYRYADVDCTYGLMPFAGRRRCRQIPTGSLEDAVISRLSNPDPTCDDVTAPLSHSFARKHTDAGFYHNILVPSIFIPPKSSHVEYALLFTGACPRLTPEDCERCYRKMKPPETLGLTAHGKPYEFSIRLLESTLLSNIVYPIYKHGVNIRHFTPGKRWDSLYTWDSGFIGLGLLECNPQLAEYVLDTYLSETDNPDYAFLFHGSPVPVQIYLYLEMLNRVNDKTHLLGYYDRARLYYEFLVGRTHGSTTARFQSGLTSTYDLFYSTSGMDDYPAQMYIHAHGLERAAAPCIATSQAIRFGKILRMIAEETGRAADAAEYDADILRLTHALRRYAWDAEAGYFGYVVHDEAGRPVGILRDAHGENLNKGFDGMYPLIAGACTKEQTRRLLGHLSSAGEIFSPVGLSAVDMSSGYYQSDGYWNGSVWFAHQWFFFKTMLDIGRPNLAFRIAATALRSWKREVDDSYNCFEMLNIATGRGGWYHQFGGLSAPLAVWADAYFKPGTITAGFDVWLSSREWHADGCACAIDFRYFGTSPQFVILAVMAETPHPQYAVTINNTPVKCRERFPGMLEIHVPGTFRKGHIFIE